MSRPVEEILNVAITSMPKTDPSWIDISTALLPPFIALIAIYIAYQQYKINDQRLRHETYERRVRIYKSVQKFLTEISANGHTNFTRCHEFYAEASEAVFLFDSPVMEYIDGLYDKGIELSLRWEELNPSDGSPRVQGNELAVSSRRRGDLFKWFVKQLTESQNLFKRHIGIAT